MTSLIWDTAFYARMSKDNPLGIGRQLEDCRSQAGNAAVTEYIDDGESATKASPRPAYEAMISAVRAGKHNRVIVWDQDRLTRKPREVEDWIDLYDAGRVVVLSASGVDLFADPFTAGVKGQMSRQEVRQLKKRLRRSLVQRAETGKPHGRPAFGWLAQLAGDGPRRVRAGRDKLDPVAAEVIRETARRLLAGASMRSITADLNRLGVTTASGGAWTAQQLRAIMLRARNAGVRTHLGQEISKGDWPAIYDRDTHDRVTALLTDPGRRTNGGAVPRHLLSKLAVCGRCETPTMVVNPGHHRAPYYVCQACHKCARVQAAVDELVTELVIARLDLPDAVGALAVHADPAEGGRIEGELAALSARLDLAADSFAAGDITGGQLKRITGVITPKIEALTAERARWMPRPDLAPMAGPGARDRWDAAPLDIRRALVDTLVTVTILPEKPKGRAPFNPEFVRVEPK